MLAPALEVDLDWRRVHDQIVDVLSWAIGELQAERSKLDEQIADLEEVLAAVEPQRSRRSRGRSVPSSPAKRAKRMTEPRFWKTIRDYVDFDAEGLPEVTRLKAHLETLSAREIVEWNRIFTELFWVRSHVAQVRNAAAIIHGGLSDDLFDYSRGALIAYGKEVFESAIADPETLVDVLPTDCLACEEIIGIAETAYETVTCRPIPDFDIKPAVIPRSLRATDFEVIRMRYPRLIARFW